VKQGQLQVHIGFFASGAQGLIMPFMGFTLPLRDASHHLAPLHALDFANR
jgi:hypothetical protein